MRPASSPVATVWITVLCLLTALFSLNGLSSAQPAARAKRAQQSRAVKRNSLPPVSTDTWIGGSTGNWSTAGNWNNGAITAGEDIVIATTTAATTVDQSFSIGTLTLSKTGDSATVANSAVLTVGGNINNTGTITLDSTSTYTYLDIGANLTLSGTGTVVLGGTAQYNIVAATAAGNTLTNTSTITGQGTIGNGSGLIIDNTTGTINANQSGLNLTLSQSEASTNGGTLEATNGGNLILNGVYGGSWTNTGGTISAATGSNVYLQGGVTVTGGTLSTTGTGWVYGDGANLVGLTTSGQFEVQNAYATTISGTINNTGTITLASTSTYTYLQVASGGATLSGGGTVVMGGGSQYALIEPVSGSPTLTNDETIEGVGLFGDGSSLVLVNNGTINANVSPTVLNAPLTIELTGGITNTGLIEATNGGDLTITSSVLTNSGSGAKIEANGADGSGNGSYVVLSDSTINGGTLSTTGAGVIYGENGSTLVGVTNAGSFTVPNANVTYISGTITNTGTITLASTSTYTQLDLNGASATLTGGGTVVMGAGTPYAILGNSGTSGYTVTNSNNTIEGDGYIGNGESTFVNKGTVDANTSGQILYIQPIAAGTDTNTSTLEATNGGILELTEGDGGTFANTGGTITAATGSAVILNGVTVNGGTLSTSGTGVIYGQGNAELVGLTNAGSFNVPNGNVTYTSGTITNTGTITLNSTSTYAYFDTATNTTLTGSGTIVMGAGAPYATLGGTDGTTLTNSNNTIEGSGYIGNTQINFVNSGTVNANTSGQTLELDPAAGTNTNTKTMEATNGGTLELYSASWTNTGGTITAAASSAVILDDTTVTGGTLTTSGKGATAGVIIGEGGATLVGLKNSGNFNVPNAQLVYLSGTITNTGTITVNSSSTYTQLDVAANTTLSGSGKIIMGAGAQYSEIGGASGLSFTNSGNTIEGDGYIGLGNLVVTNKTGSMISNTSGQTLQIQSAGAGTTNDGTFEAESGGILQVVGTLTNYISGTNTLSGGTYIADGAGTNVYLPLGTSGGITTLTASVTEEGGGQILNSNNTNNNALNGLTTITSTGSLTIGGVAFTDSGNFSNAGSLTILGGEVFKVATLSQISGSSLTAGTFVLDANLDLTGATQTITTNATNLTLAGGTIENANSTNALAGLATNTGTLTIGAAVTTTAASFSNTGTLTIDKGDSFTAAKLTQISGSTLSGAGTFVLIGNLDLTTSGISVTTNSSTLTLEGGTINSNGVNALSALASNTGNLTIDTAYTTSAAFSNTGTLTIDKSESFTAPSLTQITTTGGVTTLTAGTYVLAGNLVVSGTENITVNAANLTLEGGTIETGTTNDLANLDSNTGTLTLATDAKITTSTTANFANTGTIDVEKGSTLTVGGTSEQFNQTAGTTTVDGTLTVGASGSNNITGGTILGAGTIKANTTVGNASGASATINAGDTNKAGLLTITGTYKQLATGIFTGYVSSTKADTGYSVMKVSGTAALAGTINFTVAASFQASLKVGDTFTVLTASSVSGTFSNSTIAINSTFQFDVSYKSNEVILTVADVAPSKPAQSEAKASTPVRDLRHSNAIRAARAVVGWPTAHSNAILVRGSELNDLRSWERVPIADPVRPVAVAVPRIGETTSPRVELPDSDLRMEQSHAIGVQAPARWIGTINRREPVKTMPTMLPRITR